MPDTAPISDDGTNALHEALATADVLRRVAGTVAIHLYESEYLEDGTYVCNTFIGEGLESLLGPLPEDKHARGGVGGSRPPGRPGDVRRPREARGRRGRRDRVPPGRLRREDALGLGPHAPSARARRASSSSTGSSPTSPSGERPPTPSRRRAASSSTSPSTTRSPACPTASPSRSGWTTRSTAVPESSARPASSSSTWTTSS